MSQFPDIHSLINHPRDPLSPFQVHPTSTNLTCCSTVSSVNNTENVHIIPKSPSTSSFFFFFGTFLKRCSDRNFFFFLLLCFTHRQPALGCAMGKDEWRTTLFRSERGDGRLSP